MDRGETVEMVMVEIPTREVIIQSEAAVATGKVAVIPMAVEVTVVVEVVNHLAKFGSPSQVMMWCAVF